MKSGHRLSNPNMTIRIDKATVQWSGRTEQLYQQLNRDIVKTVFK